MNPVTSVFESGKGTIAVAEKELREAVKRLFAEDKVDLVIGHERGTLPLATTPCFVKNAEDVDRLVWNGCCGNNLASYLPAIFRPDPRARRGAAPKRPKVGVVVKGCDARSVIGHIAESQVRRGDVVLIGMPCTGMVDLRKVHAALEGREMGTGREEKGQLVVTDDAGAEHSFSREEMLSDWCLACRHPEPQECDVRIEGPSRAAAPESFSDIAAFEEETGDARWAHFEQEMSKCIRCYACRNACPLCYCTSCFAEETRPRWIGISDAVPDVMAFHIGRIYHTAGRCVECGACEAACPMGVDLRTFTRKLAKDVQELFDYEAGMDPEETPPLGMFKMDDPNKFVR
ncbi:MAG: 4Fe-4S dicluster domain-containing protein [Candidatus Latescibacterota bacterium]